jgi:hypothetical protein
MAVIARAFSRDFPLTAQEVDTLKQLTIFCCAGLVISLLFMTTYGLDLSPGIFRQCLPGNVNRLRLDLIHQME